MNTTELTDIERALELLAQVLVRAGNDGEHLCLPTDEECADAGMQGLAASKADSHRSQVQRRLAIRKSLQSASDLLGIAVQLMSSAPARSNRDFAARKKAMLQEVRVAARRTYEAGHVLIGVDFS